jgi:hypothetical protein
VLTTMPAAVAAARLVAPSAATVAAGAGADADRQEAHRPHREEDEAQAGRVGGQPEGGEHDPGPEHRHARECTDDQRELRTELAIG